MPEVGERQAMVTFRWFSTVNIIWVTMDIGDLPCGSVDIVEAGREIAWHSLGWKDFCGHCRDGWGSPMDTLEGCRSSMI